jgi:hypothetical protein
MHGPRVAITIARFLPDGLVSAIRDGPGDAVVTALEQSTETPELVWSPAMAASLGAQLATMAVDLYREQTHGHVVEWDLPEHASGQQDMRDEPQVHFDFKIYPKMQEFHEGCNACIPNESICGAKGFVFLSHLSACFLVSPWDIVFLC